MGLFLSAEPEVILANCFDLPFDNAVAAARTCYSSKGLVTAEEVAGCGITDEALLQRQRARRDRLALDIFKAGHHTVFQHVHLQFLLRNVSRHFVWSFLHSHPFYNSDQVSQRYVPVQPGTFTIPALSGKALSIYQETIETQFRAYRQLNDLLQPLVGAEFFRRFPARRRAREKWQAEVQKKAMEIARYVLPVATFTYLHHTINALTLLRYHRICEQYDTPTEQRFVVRRMIEELLRVAPEFEMLLQAPLPIEDTPEWELGERFASSTSLHNDFIAEFDASLEGRVSKLIAAPTTNESLLAGAVREVLGLPPHALSDDEAIELALSPARNHYLGETLNLTAHAKLTRALTHPHYTFRKKLSHSADSQDQRHRTTPASRPVLLFHLSSTPDYIVPDLIQQEAQALSLYEVTMLRSWEGLNELRRMGVSDEWAAYLLPNAVAIRYTQSTDLLSLRHKHAMRLCFNAQEEIWKASLDEAEQIAQVNPRIGKYLLPPCGLRHLAALSPVCPEGKRYCGVPVWKLSREQFARLI